MGILKRALAVIIALFSVILVALYFIIKLIFSPFVWVFYKIGALVIVFMTFGLASGEDYFKEEWQKYWEE